MAEHFDLIIIGSGPGGLAAALYAARGRMKTLILEKGQNGGQAAITHLIENYPGSIEDPTGPKLTHRMLEQAKNFGAEVRIYCKSCSYCYRSNSKKIGCTRNQRTFRKGNFILCNM